MHFLYVKVTFEYILLIGLEKQKAKARNAGDLADEAKLCNVAGELLSGNSKNF